MGAKVRKQQVHTVPTAWVRCSKVFKASSPSLMLQDGAYIFLPENRQQRLQTFRNGS